MSRSRDVVGWRLVLHMDDERAVRLEAQALALGAERETIERDRREEVLLVIEGDRPEAFDGRGLFKGDGVSPGTSEPPASHIEVLIEIARLARPVDEDVRLRDRRARVVIGAELGAVDHRGPVVGKRNAKIAELKKRLDQSLVGFRRSVLQHFAQGLVDRGRSSTDRTSA